MDSIFQDVRYAFRSLRQGPGLVAVAVLSLALGIAANSTIFSAVDVLMFRPLPYENSDDVIRIHTTNAERDWTRVSLSVPDFVDVREASQTVDVAAIMNADANLSGDRPERLEGNRVSHNFFRVLGILPVMGRTFTPDEERAGQDRVVIISDALWHRHFGADPEILRKTVQLNAESHTIVGVLPPGFWFRTSDDDVWLPLGLTGEESRASHFLLVLGRVQPGVTFDGARVEIGQIAQRMAEANPGTSAGNGTRIETLHDDIMDEGIRSGSFISLAAVMFVLLIACANVANLLLARVAGREREVALRRALGAGRLRIARQFLAESLVISLLGGALGLVLAVFGVRGLVSIIPPDFPRLDDIVINGRVLFYTGVVTIATGLIFGMAPVLQSAKTNLVDSLRDGSRGAGGMRSGRLRKVLVVSEIALAVTLLIASGLLIRGYMSVAASEYGFDSSDVLTFRATLPEAEYPDTADVLGFYSSLRPRLEALPGVRSVSATTILPRRGNSGTFYWIGGEEVPPMADQLVASYRFIQPGYFDAMDVSLSRGRTFEERDRVGAPRVVVINQVMADLHWTDSDPVGQRIQFGSGPREIVGVVANERDQGAGNRERPKIYFSAMQTLLRSMSWVVETSTASPQMLTDAIRAEVGFIAPNLPLYQVATLDAVIREEIRGDGIMPKVMTALSIVALLLAIGGVYGVMAYSVSQRTRELGIRMALGAQGKGVMSMIVRQGSLLAGVGVVIGIGLALAVSRTLSIFLFGVSPFDPLTFGAVAIFLLGAGVAASYFPARRATKVDPMTALRAE